MNDSLKMYDDFSNVVSNEESVSTESVLDILKEYSGSISVFDLMAVNAEMIEESKYVQENYKHKSHEVYVKYFLGRIKDVHADNNDYEHDIDKVFWREFKPGLYDETPFETKPYIGKVIIDDVIREEDLNNLTM